MKLTDKDKELVAKAKVLTGEKKVSGGVVKEVGAALLTRKGEVFTGVSLHLSCGIGFCAEHSAIAAMVSQSDETRIDTIAAYGDKVLYPCGRCRELMQQIDKRNMKDTWVIISTSEKVKLKDLLPGDARSWLEE